MRMNKGETIHRLCAIVTKVGGKVYSNQLECDCFCEGSLKPTFVMSKTVIEFVEEAVNKAIKEAEERRKIVEVTNRLTRQ